MSIADYIREALSDPGAFWIFYAGALFGAFLLLIAVLENYILKKPMNAFVMGVLFAVFLYAGIQWGKGIAPEGSAVVWQLGEEPARGGSCPEHAPIKAVVNISGSGRCTYHPPGADFYSQIRANRCYARTDQAKADGCDRPN